MNKGRAISWIESLDSSIATRAKYIYDAILRSDSLGEISKQAIIISRSIEKPCAMSQQSLQEIGDAHILAWLSYSLFDHMYDSDFTPSNLALANISHRKSLILFLSACSSSETGLILDAFDSVDLANNWELNNLRMPIIDGRIHITKGLPRQSTILGHLKSRMAGHLLPTTLVLSSYRLSEKDRTSCQSIFNNYALARQLADDLYDWEDDLRTGKMTFVINHILKSIRVKPGSYSIDELVQKFKKYISAGGGAIILNQILNYYENSYSKMNSSPFFLANSEFALTILEPQIHKIKVPLEKINLATQPIDKIH